MLYTIILLQTLFVTDDRCRDSRVCLPDSHSPVLGHNQLLYTFVCYPAPAYNKNCYSHRD